MARDALKADKATPTGTLKDKERAALEKILSFVHSDPVLPRSKARTAIEPEAALDVPAVSPSGCLPAAFLRDDLAELPELSEVEVVRHFTRLST